MEVLFIVYGALNGAIAIGLLLITLNTAMPAIIYPTFNEILRDYCHIGRQLWRTVIQVCFTILFLPAIIAYFAMLIIVAVIMFIYLTIVVKFEIEV